MKEMDNDRVIKGFKNLLEDRQCKLLCVTPSVLISMCKPLELILDIL